MPKRSDIANRTGRAGTRRASAAGRSARPRVEQTISARDKISGLDDIPEAQPARTARSAGTSAGSGRGSAPVRSKRAILLNLPSTMPVDTQRDIRDLPDVEGSLPGASASGKPTRKAKGTRSRQPQPEQPEAEEVRPSAVEDESAQDDELVSTSVRELRRQERAERMRKSSRRHLRRFVAIIGAIVILLAGWAVLYNSPAFSIQNVKVNGVEHLTSEEMAQLANVPSDTTLLRVDADTIATRIEQSSWVESVQINRLFPDTLEINVTEREVLAIVDMPNDSGTATKSWAIAQDRMWLMPIPDATSEAAQTTSSKIYEDAEAAVHIVDLPFGTKAEIGQQCTDEVVTNALDILQDMTTELAGQVIKVSAPSVAETSLFLESGVEIAFGSAEDIRDKERTILKIMEDNPDGVAYINVRMVENPTWRSI